MARLGLAALCGMETWAVGAAEWCGDSRGRCAAARLGLATLA